LLKHFYRLHPYFCGGEVKLFHDTSTRARGTLRPSSVCLLVADGVMDKTLPMHLFEEFETLQIDQILEKSLENRKDFTYIESSHRYRK